MKKLYVPAYASEFMLDGKRMGKLNVIGRVVDPNGKGVGVILADENVLAVKFANHFALVCDRQGTIAACGFDWHGFGVL